MMRYGKSIIVLALAVFLLSIAGAWASDTNDTMIAAGDDSAIELSAGDSDDMMTVAEDEDVLSESDKTFEELNDAINGNNDTEIYLSHDYKYYDSDSAFTNGIVIGRDVNVYGNGHTINGSGQARIFKISSGNVVFHDITFTNGYEIYDGGAINGECTAVNCTFIGNKALGNGGAMYHGSAVNCTFMGNRAEWSGGAMHDGSAVNCTFMGNRAEYAGGAMHYGSAVNCTFTENEAEQGGAMYHSSALNSTFIRNGADDYGDAIYQGSAVNCHFEENRGSGDAAIYRGSAVDCSFTGNDLDIYQGYYLNCENMRTTGSTELTPHFDAGDFTSTYNSGDKFYVYLNDPLNNLLGYINVNLTIFKDGSQVRSYSCLSGDALTFDLDAGNYVGELKITYPNFKPQQTNINIKINPLPVTIEVTANEATYPEDVVVNVKSDRSGEHIVKVANQSQSIVLEAGVAKDITFTGLDANELGHVINVTYSNGNYAGFNDTVRAVVHKATPKIEVTANEATYPDNVVVNVKSDIAGQYIVKVGTQTQSINLEAGTAKDIVFTGLAANELGHVVNVTHSDSANYAGFNDTVRAVVHKATPKIEVSVNEVTYPGDVIVNVKSDITGEYVIKVGDKTQNINLEANTAKNITFTGLKANETGHIINATYTETENYTASFNDTTKAIVHKATPKIEVSVNEATYPEDITVSVKADVNGTYTVKVGDKTQNIDLEANVTKNITFTSLKANETGHTVNVTYDETENYTASFNDTTKAIVHKATPKIEVSVNEATYPEDITVSVKTDVNGTYTVKVGDKTQNIDLEANVTKNITFTSLKANETGYIVNVTYDETENYTASFNDTTKAIVHKATPKIEVSVNEATYPEDVTVSVKTDVNGTYTVKVGDKTQNVTLEANVTANITFKGLAANEAGYIVNVTYNETENYTSSVNDTAIVKVNKNAAKIAAAGITATYNINKNLVITLTDSRGNPLAGAKITVNLNGAKTYTTDANGQIKIQTKGLTPKTYTAAITFDGNANYTKATANAKVIVKKAKPKIKAKKKTYRAKAKTKKFTITLKDNRGKAIKNAKVKISVKKITKKAKKKTTKKKKKKNIKKTNKKGKATFKIDRKTKGKYWVTIKYQGNKYFTKTTKKVKITLK